ncbi:MAG TPA: phosphotransferase [Acidimicrobiales bacterium]
MGVTDVSLQPRPVVSSVEELLEGATSRESFGTTDSKSGSAFERVVIDREPFIVKHVHVDSDWTMRFNGDIGCHPAQVWRSGLMDVVPERIDHGVVGVATGLGRNGWGAAILMRDVSEAMVPPGDDLLDVEQHVSFIDDLAALSARMWEWKDDVGLVPLENRWTWFNHVSLAVEEVLGWPEPVPKIASEGWRKFAEHAPRDVFDVVDTLRRDPAALIASVRSTPLTFVHGDWKLGNVGTAADGRTVLIDWTYPGESPCCFELTWYLALNRARLPMSKEDTVDRFRSSLERAGIDTSDWFERQLALSFLAALAVFGWEKALGDGNELGWWCDRAREGASLL